ncbi:hypothetical protein RA27_10715 [Ruegeria sp. ANG-R]|uniref:hypothetical protein n=1 Tax=Ruegeria sp. ANG-R TaxID=1577903 RepID=UPI00057D3086|nr:hypothetical protein [Ruegeria sp. ANG-R]KIC41106.1 hypothetical protein RA27_10715 [Ruegeria sp. ANG-R]
MKKAIIASATVFALVASAGMSTAGPLRDHGQRGFAHNVHASVSQTLNHADGMANTHQTTKSSGFSFDLPSERHLGQNNRFATEQYPTINPNWGWDLSNADVIGNDAGGYAIEDDIRLNWGQNQVSPLLGQGEDDSRDARTVAAKAAVVAVAYGYATGKVNWSMAIAQMATFWDELCFLTRDGRKGGACS